jgi:hypothetical protein
VLRTALIIAATVAGIGCASQPWYPPPEQRASLGEAGTGGLGPFVAMSQQDAASYIVQGMRTFSEGPWRWAHDRPVLRFMLPEVGRVHFEMELSFPENTFRQTGPVTLTLSLNGTVFDRVRYDKPGQQHYSHAIAAGMVRPNALNLVAIAPDKVARIGEEKMGFVLTSAGFVE